MDFPGNFEELKALVSGLGYSSEWVEKSESLVQCRMSDGVAINWNPKTNGVKVKGGPFKATRAVYQAISTAIVKRAPLESNNFDGIQDTLKDLTYTQVSDEPFYKNEYDSELVIGLVGAVGTDLKRVKDIISERLGVFDMLKWKHCYRVRGVISAPKTPIFIAQRFLVITVLNTWLQLVSGESFM